MRAVPGNQRRTQPAGSLAPLCSCLLLFFKSSPAFFPLPTLCPCLQSVLRASECRSHMALSFALVLTDATPMFESSALSSQLPRGGVAQLGREKVGFLP